MYFLGGPESPVGEVCFLGGDVCMLAEWESSLLEALWDVGLFLGGDVISHRWPPSDL